MQSSKQSASIHIPPLTITTMSLFLLPLLLLLTQPTSSQPLPLQSLSLHPSHKFDIHIPSQFSNTSDITVLVTSCNRLRLLALTMNSFFHFNTYVIRELIVVEDCQAQESKIWEIMPIGAKAYEGHFFRVVRNGRRLGQIASIDIGYALVRSKYVYHLEDDWLQLGSYGILQRLKDALQDAQSKSLKISQAVLTYPLWSWSHMLGPQHRTSHSTKYHPITSYGKDYLYSFSFNPHLLNHALIYKTELNSSYIKSIARRYHCLNEEDTTTMENGGCVEHEMGKYMDAKGYKQIWVDVRKEGVYRHIGDKGKETDGGLVFERGGKYADVVRNQKPGQKNKQDVEKVTDTDIEPIQQKIPITRPNPQPKPQQRPQKTPQPQPPSKSPTPQQQFLTQLIYLSLLSLLIFLLFKIFSKCKKSSIKLNHNKKKKSYQPANSTNEIERAELQEEEFKGENGGNGAL